MNHTAKATGLAALALSMSFGLAACGSDEPASSSTASESKSSTKSDPMPSEDSEMASSDAGQDYWRQWYLPWTAEKGQHSLAVRAVNGRDEEQTAARATPFPNGSSGVQQIVITVA